MYRDMASTPNVTVFPDGEAIARAVAEKFIVLAKDAIAARGRFSVALAGGSTPKRTYEILATDEFRGQVDWPNVYAFFGDERCVAPDHADSNFRMATNALLAHVPANVYRMVGEGDAAQHAADYEAGLRAFFAGEAWPRFDLVMFGMGDDGHTLSLFPGTTALSETEAWCVSNWVEKFNTFRITMTAPAVNHARQLIFSVTGANKASRLVEVLRGPFEPERLPSQLIKPVDGRLDWYVDQDAAANL
jgi:6-phosphogluconolactonase